MSKTSEVSIKAENQINAFIVSTKWNRSYNAETKKLFHSRGKKVLKLIAEILGLQNFDVRSCLGGIAVSGEVILHSDNLYIQFMEDSIMYRSCRDMKDYSGGTNNWMSYEQLLDINKACENFRVVMGIRIG